MPKFKKNNAEEQISIAQLLRTGDLVPTDPFSLKWVLPKLHRVSQRYGYNRVETNTVEAFDFLSKNKNLLGHAIEQCMYVGDGLSSKKFTLRPENFLSVLRAYMHHQVYDREKATRWYYVEPVYAADKHPYVDQYEFGWVHFGEPTSISEAHMISMIKALLSDLGINNVMVEINSQGCDQCGPVYRDVLKEYFQQNQYGLCPQCQQHVEAAQGKNSTGSSLYNIFKCGGEECRSVGSAAPPILDYLDNTCNHNLTGLLEILDELEVAYQLNPLMFADEDYSHTVFSIKLQTKAEPSEDKQLLLGTGGRQTAYVSKLLNRDTPVLRFSLALEGFLNMLEGHGKQTGGERVADVFMINLGEMAAKKSLRLFHDLWRSGISAAEHFGENGIKNQFKLAEQKGCPIALVVGQKEALEGTVILRDVRNGSQEVFAYDRIIDEVRKRLQE